MQRFLYPIFISTIIFKSFPKTFPHAKVTAQVVTTNVDKVAAEVTTTTEVYLYH